MGYTHYFEISKPFEPKAKQLIANAARVLFDKLTTSDPILQVGDMYGERLLSSADDLFQIEEGIPSIVFNGYGEGACESFWLPLPETREDVRRLARSFNFVKTRQRPYDELAKAIFLVAENVAPESFSVSSDGTKEDWAEIKALTSELLDMPLKMPIKIDELNTDIPLSTVFSFIKKGEGVTGYAERLLAELDLEFPAHYSESALISSEPQERVDEALYNLRLSVVQRELSQALKEITEDADKKLGLNIYLSMKEAGETVNSYIYEGTKLKGDTVATSIQVSSILDSDFVDDEWREDLTSGSYVSEDFYKELSRAIKLKSVLKSTYKEIHIHRDLKAGVSTHDLEEEIKRVKKDAATMAPTKLIGSGP